MLTFTDFFKYTQTLFECEWRVLPDQDCLPFAREDQPLIGFANGHHFPVIAIIDTPKIDPLDLSQSALIINTCDCPINTSLPQLDVSAKSYDLIEWLLPFLQKYLRSPIVKHGAMLDIFGKGVLLLGESGSGKSECALLLLTKQHRLIADDIVYFYRTTKQTLIGYAVPDYRGLLEVRDVGIIDVHQRFGPLCTMDEKALDLIIHLTPQPFSKRTVRKELAKTIISGVSIPTLSLSLAFKRDLAMLIESAVQFAFSPTSTVIEHLLTLPAMASTESTS